MLHVLTNALSPEVLKFVFAVLRVIFYLCCIAVVVFSCRGNTGGARRYTRGLQWVPVVMICVAFAAILAYQASWQLAGFARHDFVEFMEIYNRRPDNAAHNVRRGKILDSKNRVMAEDSCDGSFSRVYPYGEAAAHVVGYRMPGGESSGVENAADGILCGYEHPPESFADGMRTIGANVFKDVRELGTNVVLTIDADLQAAACELMSGRRGAVVAVEPGTGAVRALYSSPSFDPNRYDKSLGVAPDAPLLNRALHGLYPAGSTFKTMIAAMAVQYGVPLRIDCPAEGYLAPGANRPIRDHEYYSYKERGSVWGGFGKIGLDEALAKSSNTYFARAGVECGTDAFNKTVERLMMNERIVVLRGTNGMISVRASRVPVLGRGERRELSQLSIGQGRLLVTPFHMALAVCALANEGYIMRPRLLEEQEPSQMTQVFSAAAARRVREAMRYAVLHGTARKADIPGLGVCGKTGTAQNPGGEDHSWFVCFTTAVRTNLAVAVVVENAGFGSAQALPVAAGILRRAYGLDSEVSSASVKQRAAPAAEAPAAEAPRKSGALEQRRADGTGGGDRTRPPVRGERTRSAGKGVFFPNAGRRQ